MQVSGGRTAISFFPSILETSGLKNEVHATGAPDSMTGETSVGFKVAKSDLRFRMIDAHLTNFDGGALTHSGGFKMTSTKGQIDATSFSISASNRLADGLQLRVGSGPTSYVAFDLTNARAIYQLKDQELLVGAIDVTISFEGAQHLGRPELAGRLIATLSVFADSKPIDGAGEILAPKPTAGVSPRIANIDVAISNMGSLVSLGRTGSFPNGLNGLSMSTTSCNVGSQNIPWNAPMQVTHPAISMALYRVMNGRFEQVGQSWMKHGFFATNSSGCGTCQNPGTGALLGPGCSDTYGTGNNGDRNYLGGRDEMNPWTGVWTCQNSYFSNYINDCTRRNNGSGLDAVAHRLVVGDGDLGNAGATYYYEGYYVNANDNDHYNNIASRTASFSWSGTLWNVTTTDSSQVQGPAINRWGQMRDTAVPRTEGDVIVAVQTTNLGGGMWHYEYAVYNHDLDRQIREYSVPLPTGAVVQNIDFRDIDTDGTNQWSAAVANNSITWSTGVFGSATANPLKFESVYNFRFDCNVAPVNGTASLTLFKPGTGTTLTANTKVPLVLRNVDSFQVVNGALGAGNLQSLANSDDDKLKVNPSNAGSRSGTGIITSMIAPAGTFTSLIVGVESSNPVQTSANPVQTIELFNWNTSAWDLVDTRPATATDAVALITITSGLDRYINGSTREVRTRVLHVTNLGIAGNRWVVALDQVGLQFN